ncbi:MAG: efflux RND transporter periplasmic adaptor subunit [Cyanobacteria bacterium P01_A01_bin.40]
MDSLPESTQDVSVNKENLENSNSDSKADQQSDNQDDISQSNSTIAKAKQKKIPWAILIVIIMILAGAGLRLSSRRRRAKPNIDALTVPVKIQSLDIVTEASGRIEPIDSVNVSPKTTGRLTALYVEQGDKVEMGQLLAQMDSANLKAELAQAQGELAQAQAEYNRVLNGNRREAIARAKSQVRSAQAKADLAAKRAEKYRFLAQSGAIAQLTLDEYVSEDLTARASLVEAQEQLQELVTGSRPEDIEQYQARVSTAQAKVALIQTKLEDTKIRAPFDGMVSQRYAMVGSIVTPDVTASATSSATSSYILSIASELEVNAKVFEASIANIQPNQTVEIIADAYPNRSFAGKVKQIAPEAVVENNVTSFEVKVKLITGHAELRSGMNVDALFIGKTIDNALTIPTVAITTNQGEIGVMVATESGEGKFQPVGIGFSQDGQTQIGRGLEQGDRVFIDFPPGQVPQRTGLP